MSGICRDVSCILGITKKAKSYHLHGVKGKEALRKAIHVDSKKKHVVSYIHFELLIADWSSPWAL